ncbi:MAG TPA: DUF2723 domain-containing protein [Verrucomicrobiae bacterium]|jgi:hypothetical protein
MGDAASIVLPPTCAPSEPPIDSPFYRAIDWQTFALTTPLILLVYWLTLIPDIPLDSAGEWVTAAMWLGVPNPPGYPIWTFLTWLFIHLVPISTIAWRVALASATEAALACGLCGLMASRFTCFIIDGIEGMEKIGRSAQNAICSVAGLIAALSLAFNTTLWKHAVVPSIYPLPVLFLVVTLTLLFRWMYSPERRRFIYWTSFLFGLCVVNHQTLIVAAMGLEIAVIAANYELGRDLLAVNVFCWIAGLCIYDQLFLFMFDISSPMVFLLFNCIGAFSIAGMAVLIFKTKRFLTEWKSIVVICACWLIGSGFYFIVPLASMTNPPMNWGYARTVEGFYHTISRGQYDRINPADFVHSPVVVLGQIAAYFAVAARQFGLEYIPFAVMPFLFFFKMKNRERRWMIALTAVFLCLGVLINILLNPASRERTMVELVRIFYLPSFVPISIWIGCGVGLSIAWFTTKFSRT